MLQTGSPESFYESFCKETVEGGVPQRVVPVMIDEYAGASGRLGRRQVVIGVPDHHHPVGRNVCRGLSQMFRKHADLAAVRGAPQAVDASEVMGNTKFCDQRSQGIMGIKRNARR